MSGGFADHFSAGAADYARFRPTYPEALIAYVASVPARRELAWDCGTGNGQAAVALAAHFTRVRATDASAAQLAHAVAHPRVTYAEGREDGSGLDDASADLVTVAQAVHWLDLARLYAETRRVLRPGGALAIWAYGSASLDGPAGEVLVWFYHERVGRYWPPERAVVDAGLRTLAFPLPELAPPPFVMRADVTREGLVGYCASWSATHLCERAEGRSPLDDLRERLAPFWPDAGTREVRWPVALRIGRVP